MKVLITGTSRGIGRAIAGEFLNNNHIVIGMDKEESTIIHKNYIHIVKDITSLDLPTIKDVNILINNAGVQSDDSIRVNLEGSINITEKYAFQDKIVSVVFIASASSRNGAEFPRYVASKGGLISYMKNVAFRLKDYKATANSVSPGGVINELNQHILDSKELYDACLNETLLHKWATNEEIAKWVYFVSVINKSMTGEDILIDNGEILKSNFIW